MSKGPGKIDRIIAAAFAAEPNNAFTMDELLRRVYPGIETFEKKHRVAVIRAAKKRRDLDWSYRDTQGHVLVFYLADNFKSFAMMQMKTLSCLKYNLPSDDELRAKLKTPEYRQYTAKGGIWSVFFEIAKAERRGDHKTAAKYQAKLDRIRERLLA
jgi:hypothetical protein